MPDLSVKLSLSREKEREREIRDYGSVESTPAIKKNIYNCMQHSSGIQVRKIVRHPLVDYKMRGADKPDAQFLIIVIRSDERSLYTRSKDKRGPRVIHFNGYLYIILSFSRRKKRTERSRERENTFAACQITRSARA